MKFSTIIQAAGFDPKTFPRASKSDITLYGDDELNIFNNEEIIDTSENVNFATDLFVKNPAGKENFGTFLKKLEDSPVDSFNIRIDENCVTIFYKTPHPKTFSRKEPMNPLDYME